MNTNKSTTGIDPKVKLSLRKIAVITGVIFIIATVLPILGSSLIPDLTGADYLTQFSAHTNQVAAGVLLILIGVLRMCRHSRRDVSGLEEVECGSGPWICRLQDH